MYIKVTGVETFAVEIKGVAPEPGVSALEIAKYVLPPGIPVTDAEFISREEYEAGFGDEDEHE